MNKFLKLIGYQHNYGGREQSYKFSWGEIALWSKDISLRWNGPHYCYEPKLIISLYFITFFIRTPSFGVKAAQSSNEERNYGFYLYPNLNSWQSTVFQFYNKSSHIDMPWKYEWESTEHLDWDMNVVVAEYKLKGRDWNTYYAATEQYKKDHSRTFDYTYYLKNGEVQHRKASVTIVRRTWRVRGWPWKKKINTSIDVTFDDEVGERTGSWKGGTIGCSYEMLPNETPEQTLRRMESESNGQSANAEGDTDSIIDEALYAARKEQL